MKRVLRVVFACTGVRITWLPVPSRTPSPWQPPHQPPHSLKVWIELKCFGSTCNRGRTPSYPRIPCICWCHCDLFCPMTGKWGLRAFKRVMWPVVFYADFFGCVFTLSLSHNRSTLDGICELEWAAYVISPGGGGGHDGLKVWNIGLSVASWPFCQATMGCHKFMPWKK